MSTQAVFYHTDLSLDLSVAPESLLPSNGFSPEFLSLSSLENGMQHQDTGIPSIPFSLDQAEGGDTGLPCFFNYALQPAPRDSDEELRDTEVNQAPPLLPSFSSNADHDAEFSSNNSQISPHSELSSIKSSTPLCRQNRDTDKRTRHLERNRAAATKSREKKKRETDQLQNQFQKVSRRRSGLEDEIKSLRSQLLSLKDQMLMHSRCDDNAIHLYLGRMVKQARKHDSISIIY